MQARLEEIESVLQETNTYAAAYRHMHAIELEQARHANAHGSEPPQVRLHFKRGPDCRRYNEPSHEEVAAIFIGEDGAPPENRDIIIYPKDRSPQRISYLSCHLDPMCYPLPFPRGDQGWHNGMVHVSERQTATTPCRVQIGSQRWLQHCWKAIPAICC